ncbi:hypothetical protein S7335_2587 [Synechococcus sp. PCC 7335]|uniref:hypothetical protein n=1 Tax=Synechococcus sp. (strain ATCC 29403 / PCC 7335) TaxID=91464 RepID=UPI00017ECEA7|nr:hypothetical protein [Synechococcus sp. PCC 7335]EDX84888.1 hypothetical protein S7335_2587 [Synechococcus sp. PCC 7335]
MDAFLLTVYFLVVIYVLYQMALSLEDRLEDKVIIHLDKDLLAEQTQTQLSFQEKVRSNKIKAVVEERSSNDSEVRFPVLCLLVGDAPDASKMDPSQLADLRKIGLDNRAIASMLHPKIEIRVKPTGQQPIKPPLLYLSVTVDNRTASLQTYINWDNSSLEMLKQGHRVVRSIPNMLRDLSQAQVHSVVNPGQAVTSEVTIESNYIYDAKSGQMKLIKPLVNLEDRLAQSKLTNSTTDSNNIQPLYQLDLMVGIKNATAQDTELINLLIPFSFQLEFKPDQIALPPLRWVLRRTGRNRQRTRSWFWER